MPGLQTYRGRRASSIENDRLRVTVLFEGGHVAEVLDKGSGMNPLWTPPWPSIEPSTYDAALHTAYGEGVDARLLSGIMGHNLCADIFGGPSAEEAAAGLPVHGEASTVLYEISADEGELTMQADLPLAGLRIERRLRLHGQAVSFRESIENRGGIDRAIGWTQHVTLGPPFLQKGETIFRASATRSRVHEGEFGTADYLVAGADFDWPLAPATRGGTVDLQRYPAGAVSSAYTAHLMDPRQDRAFFLAYSPAARLAFGYVWKRSDFPWLGIWEENGSRVQPPWNGQTLTRGMEFGVSPFPESRRQMVERGRLFESPTFRWIPARSRVSVEYWCVCHAADSAPETLERPA
ncbi:MAG: hypothetical protein H0U94_06125 [Acidobacteria bacterium]|nr:hypothetical protein [Acidobacteriota bacterium]